MVLATIPRPVWIVGCTISNIWVFWTHSLDIRGANNAGDHWSSVLVRTGVFTGPQDNDMNDPADLVCKALHFSLLTCPWDAQPVIGCHDLSIYLYDIRCSRCSGCDWLRCFVDPFIWYRMFSRRSSCSMPTRWATRQLDTVGSAANFASWLRFNKAKMDICFCLQRASKSCYGIRMHS